MKKEINKYIDPVITGLAFIVDEINQRNKPSGSDLEILELAQSDLVTLKQARTKMEVKNGNNFIDGSY